MGNPVHKRYIIPTWVTLYIRDIIVRTWVTLYIRDIIVRTWVVQSDVHVIT